MKLIIRFTDYKKIRLELKEDRPDVSKKVRVRPERRTVDFSFDNNLDTLLIESIDKILKRNRITLTSLKGALVTGDVDKNSSAYKVAKTWVAAFKTL